MFGNYAVIYILLVHATKVTQQFKNCSTALSNQVSFACTKKYAQINSGITLYSLQSFKYFPQKSSSELFISIKLTLEVLITQLWHYRHGSNLLMKYQMVSPGMWKKVRRPSKLQD